MKIFAFSTSSEYTGPFPSSGGIVEVELGEINVFKTVHHCLDDRVSDFSLLERESMCDFFFFFFFFELRIFEVVSLRRRVNFTQLACVFVRLAFCTLFYAYVFVS